LAAGGYLEIIQALLKKKGLKLDHCDIMGRTALHIASLHCHPAAAKLLLLKGATLDQPDSLGRTPLHAAAAAQHTFLHTALANPPDRKLKIVDIDRPPLPLIHFAIPALPSQKGSGLLDVLKEDASSRRRTGGFAPWGPADSTSDQVRLVTGPARPRTPPGHAIIIMLA
jgi:ankyrin repeat protein